MIKRILFSVVLMLNCGYLWASGYTPDQQTQMVEQLTKKIQDAQSAGKSNQMILDEILTEFAAEIDETTNVVADKDQSEQKIQKLLTTQRILITCLVLAGVGIIVAPLLVISAIFHDFRVMR